MAQIRSASMFLGSRPSLVPAHAEAARAMGRSLGERRIALVYGGGDEGLMGMAAQAALDAGGEVHGVIPGLLDSDELGHPALTSLEVVSSMHERKARMAERSEAAIMLPGGFGTLDEFFEALTWTQLGIQRTPCGILEVAGFFAPLLAFLDQAAASGLIDPRHRALVVVDDDPDRLIDALGVAASAISPRGGSPGVAR